MKLMISDGIENTLVIIISLFISKTNYWINWINTELTGNTMGVRLAARFL